jgi:hypothetical protein
MAKGWSSKSIIMVHCDRQLYKNVVTATIPYEGADVKNIYPDVADLDAALVAKQYQPVPPNSVISMVIDAGCAYVRDVEQPNNKQQTPKKRKAPDVES